MKISIFNLKGGVSKTSIALNLALELNYPFIENDKHSGIHEILNKYQHKKRAFLVTDDLDVLPLQPNIIYDFKSCFDTRSEAVLKNSDLVIVPTLHSYQDIKTTISCIEALKNMGQDNILIVINRVNTRLKKTQGNKVWYTDYEATKKAILDTLKERNMAGNVRFIAIRENKGWAHSTNLGKSIFKLTDLNMLMAKNFNGAIEDLTSLLNIVNEYK